MRQTLAAAVMTMVLVVSVWAADVTGTWKAAFEGPQGAMELSFTFKTEGDKVTGSVTSPMGELPLSDVKVDGDNITFTVATDQFSVVHKGTVVGDEMKLKVDMMGEAREMVAKRQK